MTEQKRIRTGRLTLHILPETLKQLAVLAAKEERSRTQIIERLIRDAYHRSDE